jgi:hypothetical protein
MHYVPAGHWKIAVELGQ